MSIFKRKDKADRKPFHKTKVGNFLFNTKVGNFVLETVQAIPTVGTFVTSAKSVLEKDIIADVLKEANSPIGNDGARPVLNGKHITDWKNYRKIVGFIILVGILRSMFPAIADAIDPFIMPLLEILSTPQPVG